jgi:hypothetical protein
MEITNLKAEIMADVAAKMIPETILAKVLRQF